MRRSLGPLPATVNDQTVHIVPIVYGFENGELVYWDAVGLYRVD